MIDIAVIAAGAINALVPFLKKGIETISGEAGKNLYNWVVAKFKSHNKQKDLEDLGKNPDNAKLQGKVETTMENILTENPSLIAELEKLVAKAKNEVINNSKNVVTGTINAGGNIIIGDNNSV